MTLRATLTYAAGLALAVTLSACGSTDADSAAGRTPAPSPTESMARPTSTTTSPSTTTATTSASPTPAGRTLTIRVKGSTITPAPATVDLAVGESLTIRVTSDHEDTLHIHGFEVEKALAPGKATPVTVTGTQPGVYEVETHHPELRLLKIAVQ